MSGGLCSDEEIVWEYIDQQESEFLYHEIFVNKAYFNGITLNEGNIIVDAGANIGLFSLYCLSRVKNLKVCAFEPIKPIFDVLQRNLSSYFKNERKGDLKLFNAALGARNEGNQMFYYFPSAPGESTRHIIERNHQKYKIEQLIRISPDPIVHELFPQSAQKHKRKLSDMQPPEVGSRMFGDAETCYSDIITLPTAMRQAFGDDWAIDLLKIDVEGDEWNILLGLLSNEDEVSLPSSLLQGSSSPNMPYICRVRQIVLEVHDQCLETRSILSHRCGRLDHIVEFLQYYGFTVSVEQQLSRVSIISLFRLN